MKNEIKSVVITLLMTIIGFVAGMVTTEAIIIVDKNAYDTITEIYKKVRKHK